MGLGIRRAVRRIVGRALRRPAPTEVDVRGVREPDLRPPPAVPEPASAAASPDRGSAPAAPVQTMAATEVGVRQVAEPPPPKPSTAPPPGSVPAPDPILAKQKKHWEKTRKGVLAHLADNGGSMHLAALHGFSEQRFFVGHAAFSRLLEELVAEGLVTVDDEGTVALGGAA